MVSTVLSKPTTKLANKNEMQEVDAFIDKLIAKHSENAETMNLIALEATSLATSVESRSRELENQGWLKRKWNEFRGKNQKIAARNNRDLAQGQYLGQQMLNKLAENNLMTYQMVVALGNKVNRVATDANDTHRKITKINQSLTTFFANVRQKLEAKFTSLERNDDLLFWKETMMFEPVFNGRGYPELSLPETIVCLANEFYRYSHQHWSPRDLSFLKSIIVQVGHQPNQEVALKEIYGAYQDDHSLLEQLFKGIDDAQMISEASELTPTLMAFNKLQSLDNEESHIVDTVVQFAPNSSKNEVSLELTSKSILNQTSQDLSREISMFDAVMNLVEDLSFYKTLGKAKHSAEALLKNNKMEKDTHDEVKKGLESLENEKSTIKRITFSFNDLDKLNNIIIPKGKRGFLLGAFVNHRSGKCDLNNWHIKSQNEPIDFKYIWGEMRSVASSTNNNVYMSRYLHDYFRQPIYVDGLEATKKDLHDDCFEEVTLIFLDLYGELGIPDGDKDSPVSICKW